MGGSGFGFMRDTRTYHSQVTNEVPISATDYTGADSLSFGGQVQKDFQGKLIEADLGRDADTSNSDNIPSMHTHVGFVANIVEAKGRVLNDEHSDVIGALVPIQPWMGDVDNPEEGQSFQEFLQGLVRSGSDKTSVWKRIFQALLDLVNELEEHIE